MITRKTVGDILKEKIYDYVISVLGVFLLALSLNLFLIPNKLSCGGVSSVGIMLQYLYQIPISLTNIVLNLILFLLGYRFIGKSSVIKTALGILLLSLFLEFTATWNSISNDRLIVSVFGGALMGLGIGLVIRCGASTGGSDFAGMILHRFLPHISIATLIMLIDGVIVILTGIVFGDVLITFYSLLALFVSAKVSLFVLSFGNVAREVLVVTAQHLEISQAIMRSFNRGTTGIYSRGMYSMEDRVMLLCVVTPKELPQVVRLVRELDPNSFVVISDSRTVLGEGFKTHDA
ncbi:MAG: YitT family protein [Ruminococcaceae bacterium]|nr:YitT family protein [Oscillospiraceae bacterium]